MQRNKQSLLPNDNTSAFTLIATENTGFEMIEQPGFRLFLTWKSDRSLNELIFKITTK